MNAPESNQASHARYRALLATCVAAAVRGAEAVRQHTAGRAALTWERKGAADFVTVVDRAAEAAVAAVVGERHPEAVLVGEELSPEALLGKGLVFVCDPLDGTTNFLHGFPWYAVSIAALEEGEPVAGAVLNIPTGELFTATLGGGARRARAPHAAEAITVSGIDDPSLALFGTGIPFKHTDTLDVWLRTVPAIMRSTAGIRRAGSAALDLCDVACGRFDAFWEFRLAPWDVAAGILIVREAGGIVTDVAGARAPVDHGPIVAGNPAMHAWLLRQLGGGAEAPAS
jgi:myo-inositol-1(or 4)-monophosphatase